MHVQVARQRTDTAASRRATREYSGHAAVHHDASMSADLDNQVAGYVGRTLYSLCRLTAKWFAALQSSEI